jgi:hypothetical protein
MDQRRRLDPEGQGVAAAPVRALSPTDRKPVASVPASFVPRAGHEALQPIHPHASWPLHSERVDFLRADVAGEDRRAVRSYADLGVSVGTLREAQVL